MNRRLMVALLLVLLPISSGAWAWGDEGHKVVYEIALRLVQPNTCAEIQKLISTDERFDSFSDSCTWPDHPRQRASEHFLNLPRDSDGLHSESCPAASACTVTAIRKDFEVLSSNSASQAQKLASSKFLGHWVGDIHQPLHVSFEDDRGGNGILVTGICGTANLHSAWDTCLVLRAVGEDVNKAATELMKTITPARIESWTIRSRRIGQTNPSPSRNRRRRNTAFDKARPVTSRRGKCRSMLPMSWRTPRSFGSNCRKRVSGSRICSMQPRKVTPASQLAPVLSAGAIWDGSVSLSFDCEAPVS
jgi:hypothetical protein